MTTDSLDSQATTADSLSQESWAGEVNWTGRPQTPRNYQPTGGPRTPQAAFQTPQAAFQAPMFTTPLGPGSASPRHRKAQAQMTPRSASGASCGRYESSRSKEPPLTDCPKDYESVLAMMRDNSSAGSQEIKDYFGKGMEELQDFIKDKVEVQAVALAGLIDKVQTLGKCQETVRLFTTLRVSFFCGLPGGSTIRVLAET